MPRCQRCGKETNITIMSMFDTSIICMDCKKIEQDHPDYKKAQDAEMAALRSGNRNFPGIGWKP